MPEFKARPLLSSAAAFPSDWHPLVKSIYAARLQDAGQVEKRLRGLSPPEGLVSVDLAAERLMAAIAKKQHILIYGDYDVDGASATALMVRVLRGLGATVDYFIPNRWAHGYGLSVSGLEALSTLPDLVVTVDNGIRSHAGADWLAERQIDLIITDHHEPDDSLPHGVAVVNPKRRDSHFPSRNLAGVGVAFYLLLALRQQWLQQCGEFPLDLTGYLDLVALGTVADVVPLDQNNRILVANGLQRVQRGQGNPGIRALCQVANLPLATMTAQDIGFALGPRLNAVGRLDEMSDGVAMLLTDDWQTAQDYAQLLDGLNRDRKALESEITQQAMTHVNPAMPIACAYQPDWHEGVIGIVASRLKSNFSRPALVATNTHDQAKIKASLRSVAGVNIHDLLSAVQSRFPVGALQFGGHAMAAGLTVEKAHFSRLTEALCEAFHQSIGAVPESPLWIDGELSADLLSVDWARYLEQLEPWGTELPAPTFCNEFIVMETRRLGAQHTRLILRESRSGREVQAAWFFKVIDYDYSQRLKVAYQLQVNRFFGDERLNLLISYAEPVGSAR